MPVLKDLVAGTQGGAIEVADLTAPLSERTPILTLPEPFGNTGLTQLRNLDRLPPTGAVLVAGPLPIEPGSGSPARVLALVER